MASDAVVVIVEATTLQPLTIDFETAQLWLGPETVAAQETYSSVIVIASQLEDEVEVSGSDVVPDGSWDGVAGES